MDNVYIHIGPPKSGTSAIQKWLNENREYLLTQHVYYPEHELDENGVSSGNLLALFDTKDADVEFDEDKLEKLMNAFADSKAKTLLLSSEFFFKKIELLAEKLPNAVFIGYLRFPLEVAESSYNQGVKRHGQTNAFGLPATPRAYQLEILDRLIKNAGKERFVLRPYHEACFVGGNLVEDFLSQINVHAENINHARVNSSYTLEGLEFKRWFNQLSLDDLQYDMDKFLQSDKVGERDYSFVPPVVYEQFKTAFVEQITNFCNEHEVSDKDTFIAHCEHIQQRPKMKQHINDTVFASMLNRFLQQPGVLRKVVVSYETHWKYQQPQKAPERLDIVRNALPLKERVAFMLRKFVGNVKRARSR